MKRLMLAAAALAVPLLGVASTQAASLNFGGYSGPIKIKLGNKDTGVIYSGADGTYTKAQIDAANAAAISSGTGVGTAGGLTADRRNLGSVLPNEDAWGVLTVTAIYKGGATADETPGNALFLAGLQPFEITAIFFGQSDSFLKISDSGANQEIHSTGLEAAFFLDSTQDYSTAPGPAGRTNVAGVPQYTGITDSDSGKALWTFKSTTGFVSAGFTPDPTSEFFTSVAVNGSTVTGVNGVGGFNAVVDNSGTNPFGVGEQNALLDPTQLVTVTFTGSGAQVANGPTSWLISSQDPILAVAAPLPTPGTAMAGGVMMAGLAMGGLMRRRSTRTA
jgi:hypothetical protein